MTSPTLVLVTGATGYIGSAIVEKLLQAGHQVTGFARSDASAQLLEKQGAGVLRGDLNDTRTLANAARAAEGVIHNAFDMSTGDFAASNAIDARAVDAFSSHHRRSAICVRGEAGRR